MGIVGAHGPIPLHVTCLSLLVRSAGAAVVRGKPVRRTGDGPDAGLAVRVPDPCSDRCFSGRSPGQGDGGRGAGGDGADTFNISTAVAFTAAACGVEVAKHGNRSASGKVGSADVLEGLGLNLKAPLQSVVDAIPAAGVTFLFAPAWHPALVNLAPLRRSLGVRTVFNLLGPLVNPLKPQAQVLGVAKKDLLDPMAGALQRLGLERAVVVHGAGGLDEASLAGPNDLRLIEAGAIRSLQLSPDELGLATADLEALKGGDLDCNQTILQQVLQGRGEPAQRDVVALNTALVLWAAGIDTDLSSASARAAEALDQGLPWTRLETLRQHLAS